MNHKKLRNWTSTKVNTFFIKKAKENEKANHRFAGREGEGGRQAGMA